MSTNVTNLNKYLLSYIKEEEKNQEISEELRSDVEIILRSFRCALADALIKYEKIDEAKFEIYEGEHKFFNLAASCEVCGIPINKVKYEQHEAKWAFRLPLDPYLYKHEVLKNEIKAFKESLDKKIKDRNSIIIMFCEEVEEKLLKKEFTYEKHDGCYVIAVQNDYLNIFLQRDVDTIVTFFKLRKIKFLDHYSGDDRKINLRFEVTC